LGAAARSNTYIVDLQRSNLDIALRKTGRSFDAHCLRDAADFSVLSSLCGSEKDLHTYIIERK